MAVAAQRGVLAPTNPRDPDWPLPDKPDHPYYEDVVRRIRRGNDESHWLFKSHCVNDFWFFTRYCLTLGRYLCEDPDNAHYGKPWMDHPWLFDRARELQLGPDGFLDLWSRYHFKTALVTQSQCLWDLIHHRNQNIGIVTYKLSVGESMLSQIKREAETNPNLLFYFPEVFWKNPKKESPVWRRDRISFRSDLNPKEPTIMMCGLIESQAVSQHFDLIVFDDIVTSQSVENPQAITRANRAWEEASALDKDNTRKRYVGTRWHPNDTYDLIEKKQAATLRVRPGISDKQIPFLRSAKYWARKKVEMGPAVYSAQMLLAPVPEGHQVFNLEWIKWYDEEAEKLKNKGNVYLFCDPQGMHKKQAKSRTDPDYTTMAVVCFMSGIPRGHYFVLDLVRDRMTAMQMTDWLFELNKKWEPEKTIMEAFGCSRDKEHLEMEMRRRGQVFTIETFRSKVPKPDRIARLQPLLAAGELWFPRRRIIHEMDGVNQDIVHVLMHDEMKDWSRMAGSRHDDLMDSLSWIVAPELTKKSVINFPLKKSKRNDRTKRRNPSRASRRTAWST